jgi:glycosyltransferase involved in cell wall biosynthesis
VSDADLPALYSGARLFVFPSLYEGFGLPVLEAMACGAPVACSNTSSLPEVLGEAGVSFDPLDVQSIGDAIARVIDNRSLKLSLRERGLQRAAQLTWERTAQQTLGVYQSILTSA